MCRRIYPLLRVLLVLLAVSIVLFIAFRSRYREVIRELAETQVKNIPFLTPLLVVMFPQLKPVSLQGPQPALALSCSFLPETCPSPSTPDRNTVKDILERKYPEIDSSSRHQSVLFAETGLR